MVRVCGTIHSRLGRIMLVKAIQMGKAGAVVFGDRKMSESVPDPVDIYVGSRVRMRRLMLGLSQDKLAESVGLTFQQIQKYEKGSNRIGASRLFQLAKALDVSVQYFYEDLQSAGGKGGITDDLTSLLSTPDGLRLCRYFSAISDSRLRRTLLDLVQTLADNDLPACRDAGSDAALH